MLGFAAMPSDLVWPSGSSKPPQPKITPQPMDMGLAQNYGTKWPTDFWSCLVGKPSSYWGLIILSHSHIFVPSWFELVQHQQLPAWSKWCKDGDNPPWTARMLPPICAGSSRSYSATQWTGGSFEWGVPQGKMPVLGKSGVQNSLAACSLHSDMGMQRAWG